LLKVPSMLPSMSSWLRLLGRVSDRSASRLVCRRGSAERLLVFVGCLSAAQLGGCIVRCDAGDGTCNTGLLSLPLLDPASNQSVTVTIERSADQSVVVTCTWQAEQSPAAWVCDPPADPNDTPVRFARADGIANAAFAYEQLGADHSYLAHIQGASETDVTLVRRPTSAGDACGCDTGVFEMGVAPLHSVGAQTSGT
jgi:hypothetical protein